MKSIYCCKECATKISRESAVYGNGLCWNCHKIKLHGDKNPNWKGGKKNSRCILCGQVCTYGAKYCQKCFISWRKENPNRSAGYIDGRASVCCIDCNTIIKNANESQERCWDCYQKIHKVSDHYCQDCGKILWRYNKKTTYCKKCANKGQRNANFGKTMLIKNCKYKTQWFKSSWEANFAKWCDLSGIKWEYEPKAFVLKINNTVCTYTPDFYLREFDLWIEVKGRWYEDAKEKYNAFIQQYSQINIEIFNKEKLEEYSIYKYWVIK